MLTQKSPSLGVLDSPLCEIKMSKLNKQHISERHVTKLKNLLDVHSILLGAVENDFQFFRQKESYEIASDL